METSATYPLPPALAPFAGQIVDVDGHEFIPISSWQAEFGSITDRLRDALITGAPAGPARDRTIDDTPIRPDTVFAVKNEAAPGGISLGRRLDVLDYVGVDRQMIYPGMMPLIATVIYGGADDARVFPMVTGADRRAYAAQLIATYNDWCIRQTKEFSRYRFVAVLLSETLDDLMTETRRLIANGIRAFWAPASRPIAGYSPAHTALDPFWALLAETGAPFLSHVGAEWGGFFASDAWRDAPAFEGWKMGGEFPLDPWTLNTLHLPTQNVLTCLTMGGVFERHPELHFGAAEVGAYWVGPLAAMMDLWHANNRKFLQVGGETPLTMSPSDYIRRNVRVSGYDIEDIGDYIRKYGMSEVYCYTADFPHLEGGKRPIESFADSLDGLGDDVFRQFFVDNGRLLYPPN